MTELDLMDTLEIIQYLGRHRFSQGMVVSGIKNDNYLGDAKIFTFLKGSKENLEQIGLDVKTKVNERLYGK